MTLAFIVGSPRSGTTSMSDFASALGAEVDVEPAPALHLESRLVMQGVRPASMQALEVLDDRLGPKAEHPSRVFVEKNVTYGPFLHLLAQRYDARIIYVIRDGRDVVSSWMAWNQGHFGTAYREQALREGFTCAAERNALALPLERDLNDLAHPRPRTEALSALDWIRTSWIHKFSQMWSMQNAWHLESFLAVRPEARVVVRTGQSGARTATAVADALGLPAEDQAWESALLRGSNTLASRLPHVHAYPRFSDWTDEQREDFVAVAQPMMQELGYAPDISRRAEPQTFGELWRAPSADRNWYRWMHDSRPESARYMHEWMSEEVTDGSSFLEVGCGAGIHFPAWITHTFPNSSYTGVDLSASAIRSARVNSAGPRISYEAVAVSEVLGHERFDVVFSQATVDNVPDMDAFVHDMIRLAREWVVLSCFRDTITDPEHEYDYVAGSGYFSNRLSLPAFDRLMQTFPSCEWRIVRVHADVSGVDEAHIIIRKARSAAE